MPTRLLVMYMPVFALVLAAPLAPAQNQRSPSQATNSEWPQNYFFRNLPEKLTALTGKPAPELQIAEWYDNVQVLPEHLTGKVVVIDFWGTWCPPCIAAIPKNVALVSKYQSQGLAFIGVHDARRGWDRVPQVMRQGSINYPVGRDADGGLSAREFGLGFWPTYIIVDRAGIVRAAGVSPNHIEDIVKVLIAEAPPKGAQVSEPLDARFLLGTSRRPAELRELEGKPLPAFEAQAWAGDAVTAEDMEGRVVAVQFLSTRHRVSMHHASELAALEGKLGEDFVAIAIAPAEDDWDRLQGLAAEGDLPRRLMHDAPVDPSISRRALGAYAAVCGVRSLPVIVLVDRHGMVRGAGVRPNLLEEAAELLLEEPGPETDDDAKADGGG